MGSDCLRKALIRRPSRGSNRLKIGLEMEVKSILWIRIAQILVLRMRKVGRRISQCLGKVRL